MAHLIADNQNLIQSTFLGFMTAKIMYGREQLSLEYSSFHYRILFTQLPYNSLQVCMRSHFLMSHVLWPPYLYVLIFIVVYHKYIKGLCMNKTTLTSTTTVFQYGGSCIDVSLKRRIIVWFALITRRITINEKLHTIPGKIYP